MFGSFWYAALSGFRRMTSVLKHLCHAVYSQSHDTKLYEWTLIIFEKKILPAQVTFQ